MFKSTVLYFAQNIVEPDGTF